MYSIGIDIGSVSTKGVLFDGQNWEEVVLPTGWMPKEMGQVVLDRLCQTANVSSTDIKKVVGTGYGRIHLPFADKIVSELSCHGRGAHFLFPEAKGKCPFFHFSDAIMAETTCDGKKKMYELMAKMKPMVVLDIPNSSNYAKRKEHWMDEIIRAKAFLEEQFGVEVTAEKLSEVVQVYNQERKLLMELVALNKTNPAPITGTDLLKVLWGRSFQLAREEFTAKVRELIEELKDVVATRGEIEDKGPRILVTGTPTGVGQEKVMNIIQGGPAQVILQEACSGIKGFVDLVDETINPYEALAQKHMDIPCSCTSPNQGRFDLIGRLVKEYNIQGVVDITLQACHTYNIESYSLKEYLKNEHNIPLLQVETDYSESDVMCSKSNLELMHF